MRITAIQLENVRGFQYLPKTGLSDTINIFIGSNNSGKSTILNSIFLLQRATLNANDITIGKQDGEIILYFSGNEIHGNAINPSHERIRFILRVNQGYLGNTINGDQQGYNRSVEREPDNLIYPYLSKRKTIDYADTINETNANSVSGNFTNLYSKIDRLIAPQYKPGNQQYIEACNNILGFEVSTLALGGGKKAVYYIHNSEHIPLTAMGEGVANILGLITDLCVAENQIFLIEEPENDIHPKALKELLKLIIEKSNTNQFFISTHSNIVMKYLGGVSGSKIFNITNNLRDDIRNNLFVSELTEISNSPEDRRQVLEDLGYDFFDFDLWKGWLFLEESSAEVIIRDYLIDWFIKPLKNKIKTFSTGGTGNVIKKFENFNSLFVFLHLEPAYKNKVWVIIDGGKDEQDVITKMQNMYSKSGWHDENFSQFKEHHFENYYPEKFKIKFQQILEIVDANKKQNEKKLLLNEVKLWIDDNEQHAKEEFSKSAKEVIDRLLQISEKINK